LGECHCKVSGACSMFQLPLCRCVVYAVVSNMSTHMQGAAQQQHSALNALLAGLRVVPRPLPAPPQPITHAGSSRQQRAVLCDKPSTGQLLPLPRPTCANVSQVDSSACKALTVSCGELAAPPPADHNTLLMAPNKPEPAQHTQSEKNNRIAPTAATPTLLLGCCRCWCC
jgi:hypothetical protein